MTPGTAALVLAVTGIYAWVMRMPWWSPVAVTLATGLFIEIVNGGLP